MECFGQTDVEFLDWDILYHCPTLITVDKVQSFGPKPFKFFNFWVDHDKFLDWVFQGWNLNLRVLLCFKFVHS